LLDGGAAGALRRYLGRDTGKNNQSENQAFHNPLPFIKETAWIMRVFFKNFNWTPAGCVPTAAGFRKIR